MNKAEELAFYLESWADAEDFPAAYSINGVKDYCRQAADVLRTQSAALRMIKNEPRFADETAAAALSRVPDKRSDDGHS